jgi:hypothetical protein
MAIRYPSAGTIYYTQFSCASIQSICDGIKDALVACGWQNTPMPSRWILTFSGVPSNNETCSLGGLTYTFKTVINNSNAREVLIGASATACANNLAEAINAGSGSGTDYSSATTAAGTFTATAASGVLTILTAATGFDANSQLTFTESLTNATTTNYSNSNKSVNRGYKLTMPVTPQGLCASVLVEDIGLSTYARVRYTSQDGTTAESTEGTELTVNDPRVCGWIAVSAGRSLEFCGNAHQFFIFLLGDSATGGVNAGFGVPYIRDLHAPLLITGATNASPIEITTSTDHGYSTGADVFIADVQGNTAANGFWTITVTASNKFTLNSSTGNGTYNSTTGTYYSGGVVGDNSKIMRCLWGTGDYQGTHENSFRNDFSSGNGDYWVCLNQFHFKAQGSGNRSPFLVIPKHASDTTFSGGVVPEWGSKGSIVEPAIGMRINSTSGNWYRVGQLWAAFAHLEPMPMDRTNTGFDSHDWINITDGSSEARGSLWLAKS